MKRKIAAVLGLCMSLLVMAAPRDENFTRGIAYFLLNDRGLADKYLGMHFRENPQPDLRLGYDFLLSNQQWEATKRFNKYLENNIRQRFLEALVGAALSLRDMGGSSAVDNLNRALRLSFNYVPALLCLGAEYIRMRNYPEAEMVLQKALKYEPLAESKLMLGRFYIEIGQFKKALDLLRPEADALPQNTHLNLAAAQAALEMNQLEPARQYAERCLRINPQMAEAQLVQGKILGRQGEWKRAKSLLEKLRFNYYNIDYSITMAETLVQLQDSDAEKYLYEAYSQSSWHPKVNRLFAVYSAQKRRGNPQNWINRALLAGVGREELQKEVGGFQYPQFPALPFFEVKKVCWLDAATLAVAGRMKSGDGESIFVVGTNPLAVIKSFPYYGSVQALFPAPAGDKLIFSTTAVENERIWVYHLQAVPKRYSLKPVSSSPLRFASMIGAYSEDGSEFFFTDGTFPELTFESPFSVTGGYGRRILLYPEFSFPVYAYKFAVGALSQVRDEARLRRIPVDELKKYFLVADAYSSNGDVASIIGRGQLLELTSSEYVKIHFAEDRTGFIIYYADKRNAFQAIIYHSDQNKAYRADETMFLGKKKYAELKVLGFDPRSKHIYVLTKDKDRELIRFSYASLLYEKVDSGVLDFYSPPSATRMYFLTEKKKYTYYVETTLSAVSLANLAQEKVDERFDFSKIMGGGNASEPIWLSTYSGEFVKKNDDGSFSTVQVSFDGAPSSLAPDRKQAALFVNGKLLLLKWMI